jgi:hypothetical protein
LQTIDLWIRSNSEIHHLESIEALQVARGWGAAAVALLAGGAL